MKTETKTQLLKDCQTASCKILERLSGNEPNLEVRERLYLSPVCAQEVELKDVLGEVRYYQQIRRVLEDILMRGKTFDRIDQAPKYVCEFFEYL